MMLLIFVLFQTNHLQDNAMVSFIFLKVCHLQSDIDSCISNHKRCPYTFPLFKSPQVLDVSFQELYDRGHNSGPPIIEEQVEEWCLHAEVTVQVGVLSACRKWSQLT